MTLYAVCGDTLIAVRDVEPSNMAGQAPGIAQDAVLVPSGELPVEPIEVKGYDFNDGVDYSRLLKSYSTTGFQATNFARAVNEINRMVCRVNKWLL